MDDPIVCFGDSLTEGWGVEPEEAFPARLEALLKVPVVNAGWRGDRAVDALDRLDSQVLSARPRLVVVFFGGNEADTGDPLTAALEGQEEILRSLQGVGVPALVVAHPYAPYGEVFQTALRALARAFDAGFVANALDGIAGHPELLVDDEHPNAEGHRRLAERLRRPIEAALRRIA